MNIHLTNIRGLLIPSDEEAREYISKLEEGQVVYLDIKKRRNYQFHKKLFALFNFLYSHWEPQELQDSQWQGVVPERSFETFRRDLTILAGHYEAFYRVDGSIRIEAKSLSFGKMGEEEFENLYSNVINVGLKHILTGYDNREQVDNVIMELLDYG